MLEPSVRGLGYELVDVESHNRGRLLRVFIDQPSGVTVDDCARVSNHLSHLLAAEGIDYDTLEVSSPGLDRLLRKEADFVRFRGEKVTLRLRVPVDGRRRFTGTLGELVDGMVRLEVEGKMFEVPLADLDQARLVPRY